MPLGLKTARTLLPRVEVPLCVVRQLFLLTLLGLRGQRLQCLLRYGCGVLRSLVNIILAMAEKKYPRATHTIA